MSETTAVATNPISFNVYNNGRENVLYMVEGDNNVLNCFIKNDSGCDIAIQPITGAPSETNYNFMLHFRAGVLKNSNSIVLSPLADWRMERITLTSSTDSAEENGVLLCFGCTSTSVIPRGGTLNLKLLNICADDNDGARGTNVELKYRNIAIGSENLIGYTLDHLQLVDHHGESDIPLDVYIYGSNIVLNNGNNNLVRLRLKNIATVTDKTILFKGSNNNSVPTKLFVSFDSGPEFDMPWALGTDDQVKNIRVGSVFGVPAVIKSDSTYWDITSRTLETGKPVFEIILKDDVSLAPGEHVEIWILDIITSHPKGLTNLYFQYENIPGYWDGQFVCTLEKSMIVTVDGNVGVGTASPLHELDVQGDLAVSQNLYITEGNVGIGTNTPADKLEVSGNLRILSGTNPIRFTSSWSAFPDNSTNRAEICNETSNYKTLMIVGNKSAGMVRRVSVWDRLEVNGDLVVSGKVKNKSVPVADEENLRIIRGYIYYANGYAQKGSGFSFQKIGTGLFKITFNNAFTDLPTVVATKHYGSNGSTLDNAVITEIAVNYCVIKIGDSGGNAADGTNRNFTFIVMGTMNEQIAIQ